MVLRRANLLLLIPAAALLLRLASAPTANISYFFIAAYALSGRVQAMQAIALSWLFSMLNPAIAPSASVASLGRYAVLLAAAMAIIMRKPASLQSGRSNLLVVATLMLGGFLVAHSAIFSAMVDVSVLKAISWTLAMVTLFAGWSGLSDSQRMLLSQQLFNLLVLIMLVSLPLLAFSAGYLPRKSLFMGVMGHSQSLGLTMALLGTWTAVRLLEVKNPPWKLVFIAATAFGLTILSGARTAALAMLLAVVLALFIGPALTGFPFRKLLPGLRSRRVHILMALALVGLVLAWPRLSERAEVFIEKSGGSGDVVEAYQLSRGALIDAMWANIEQKPLEGIGFGIASLPELMIVTRDPVLGLPTSAIVEKGVLPVAVLEEVGLFGFVFFLAWVWIVLRRCARRGAAPLALFIAILLVNMGEATLFSSGGVGLLAMILTAWAATGVPLGKRRR